MKRFTFTALTLAGFCVGCTPHLNSESRYHQTISAVGILSTSASPSEKSEQLAQGAEALMTAQGFQQAADLTELALKEDSKNLRARFLKVLLAPALLQKGLAVRLAPLAEKDPQLKNDLERTLAELKMKEGSEAAFAFLNDGSPDIQDEKSLQAHLDQTLRALESLRSFLSENKANEITFKVPVAFQDRFIDKFADGCEIKENAKYEYELTCPPNRTLREVSLNRADFEILHGMSTYAIAPAIVANAIDVSGAVAVLAAKKGERSVTTQELIEALLSDSSFARVRDAAAMKRFRGMALDLVAGARWGMANQATLCPVGPDSPLNRVGMLINNGLYMPAAIFANYVDIFERAASGQAKPVDVELANGRSSTSVNWTAVLDSPPSDLRSLGPLQYDSSGRIASFGDPTVGGMFPNGDLNTLVANGLSRFNLK